MTHQVRGQLHDGVGLAEEEGVRALRVGQRPQVSCGKSR